MLAPVSQASIKIITYCRKSQANTGPVDNKSDELENRLVIKILQLTMACL